MRRWVMIVVSALGIAFGIQLFVARPFQVPSPSMEPTIDIGDRVMVNRLSYRFGEIERGQVIVFDTPEEVDSDEDFFIKRVIALPGETIQLRDGRVYVGDQRVLEPYVVDGVETRQGSRPIPGCTNDVAESQLCTVPADHVFVMGDNRTRSVDSRVFGPVPVDTIVGRAMFQVWPLSGIERL